MTIRAERTENTIQLLILLVVGPIAGAASFTHVHDWTMHNVPPGTGGWFGWANAVISELTPTAAGLDIRRRKRNRQSIRYPMAVLIAAATLSLSAQFTQAQHSFTGWLLAAVPALAFLALSKLVLSRTTITPERSRSSATAETPTAAPVPSEQNLASIPSPAPAAATPASEQLPAPLLASARMAAFAHHQATGHPITATELATHLNLPPDLAGTLLHALDGAGGRGTTSTVTTVNGTPIAGSRP